MQPGIELIVGLGNPGKDYQDTRHNAGFWFIEGLAELHGAAFRQETRFHGDTARIVVEERRCRLLRPTAYMNRSGRAVSAMCGYFRIAGRSILVVHDDIDLPPGSVRLKRGGGHGGHNGLRDIMAALGGDADFLRLRIGVGHPGSSDQVVDYVLSKPPAAERVLIQEAIGEALHMLPTIIAGDYEGAMRHLHASGRKQGNAGQGCD